MLIQIYSNVLSFNVMYSVAHCDISQNKEEGRLARVQTQTARK